MRSISQIFSSFAPRLSGKAVPPSCGPVRFFEPAKLIFRGLKKAFVCAAFLVMVPQYSIGATPPGTTITNTATASFVNGGTSMISTSNTASVVTIPTQTPAVIEILRYTPGLAGSDSVSVSQSSFASGGSSGPLNLLNPPTPLGSSTAIDLSQPVSLSQATLFHIEEPVFIRLTDPDQNLNPAAADTIFVTVSTQANGDSERLMIVETGPNTGIFAGYIMSTGSAVSQYDGTLTVAPNDNISVSYTDLDDLSDTSADAALVDPYGMVFDTSTGLPVNGATVTIVYAVSGSPAVVYGDDGVSSFPSTVTTGGTATDSGGAVYTFPPGGFRFPYVLPNTYRFDVLPPAGYNIPSQVATSVIQTLPGAPFAIEVGSRLEDFIVNPGPALHIDIPADPLSTTLYVTKAAGKDTVAVGDFLKYMITVENTSAAMINNVSVQDRLPAGFRYPKGSVRVDGAKVQNPQISSDGRTMTFLLGTLNAGQKVNISYVVEVAALAKTGKAINYASASAPGGITSNTARAEVKVIEDLFRSKTLIMGRVFPYCEKPEDHPSPQSSPHEGRLEEYGGVEGVRIYMEDGTYVVTDKNGMYHFEGVKPGAHVVQLDKITIPEGYDLTTCEENNRFAGVNYSQFVDLQGGTMWRADFYLAPKPRKVEEPKIVEIKGEVSIELNSVLKGDDCAGGDAACRADVEYEIPVHIGKVPLKNLRLSIILPVGTDYLKGSSSIDGTTMEDPSGMGNTLTYRVGDVDAGLEKKIRFTAKIIPGAGETITKAVLTFDTSSRKNLRAPAVENAVEKYTRQEVRPIEDIILRPRFAVLDATLSVGDKKMLDRVIEDLKKASITSIEVIGHTDSDRISRQGQKKFADNYKLSLARAASVGKYIADGLGLPMDRVSISGKGPDEPVAENRTVAGKALNRRVELRVTAEEVSTSAKIKNIREKSGVKTTDVVERIEEKQPAEIKEETSDGKNMPEFKEDWLDRIKPGFGWLWPHDGYYPPIPSTKLVVAHRPGSLPRLYLNGEEVNKIYYEGSITRKDGGVAASLWSGVHLKDGDNIFEAAEYDTGGSETGRIRRTIHYSGLPVKADLILKRSRMTADGRNPVIIAVRFTDNDGHPVSEGAMGEYSVNIPYIPHKRAEDLQAMPLAMSKSDIYQYKVAEDGTALIELDPTLKTGEVILRFKLMDGDKEVRTWLVPEEREWILVGLAEGTAGYNTVSGNMESLRSAGSEVDYYDNGRLAFFAKGMIQGKWLLTMAYDSDKENIKKNDSLHQVIDPDKYYMLYGDATQQGYEAASARALYVKIERDRFYALFGDYETGLTVTELSRYTRSFNGLKSEMKGERFDFNVFASDTNQAFVKDEIRGDGTSGLYRLSRKNIVINSETVTIETRDRFRSEVVVSSQSLSRHIDYNIDYDSGTIYFKSPVYSRDENFNPIYIVVDYESFDPSDMSFNYGGRGAARFLDNKVEVGVTHVHEGRIGGEGNLYGADTAIKLNETTKLRAEVAGTETDFNNVDAKGNAYLAGLSRSGGDLQGSVYVREQEAEFGLGQQRGSETGMRKYGFEGTYRLNEKVSIRTEASKEENLSTDATRNMEAAEVRYSEKKYSLHGGIRRAEDEFDNGENNLSHQLTVGGDVRMLNDRLSLRLERDQSIMNNDNVDFPTRTILGADYKVSEGTSVFAAQEFTEGDDTKTTMTRFGIKSSPWTGGQISSSLEQQATENGTRVFSVAGLKQSYQINKKWSLDGGLERSQVLRDSNERVNMNAAPASGGSDFTAVSAGAAFKEDKWGWTGRMEKRYSDEEDKTGIFTGLYGEVREGLALAAALQSSVSNSKTNDRKNGDLRLGLAYRPKETKWIVLDRMDFLYDEQSSASSDYDNWRVINNLNANWKPDRKTQVSFQYGAKYVRETIDDDDYSGYTDLIGLEGRYDITKKWDIGLRGNILHSWEADQYRYGYGPSVGYNVMKNVWISVGYNIEGFRDRDFSRADYTAEGPYIRFRMKFDQGTVKDAVRWVTGQGGTQIDEPTHPKPEAPSLAVPVNKEAVAPAPVSETAEVSMVSQPVQTIETSPLSSSMTTESNASPATTIPTVLSKEGPAVAQSSSSLVSTIGLDPQASGRGGKPETAIMAGPSPAATVPATSTVSMEPQIKAASDVAPLSAASVTQEVIPSTAAPSLIPAGGVVITRSYAPAVYKPAHEEMKEDCSVPKEMDQDTVYVVRFPFGSSIPATKCDRDVIQALYKYLKENEDIILDLEGHTDQIGAEAYNKKLGLDRAREVEKILFEMGLPAERVYKLSSRGKSQPVCSSIDDGCRKKNRRVAIRFIES